MYKSKLNLWRNLKIYQYVWRNNNSSSIDPPSPTSDEIIAENGSDMISEAGDLMFTEGV